MERQQPTRKPEEPQVEPTGDECSENAFLPRFGGWACWYPQMGGYVAKCVVVPDADCFEALVWHDGTFPFDSKTIFDPAWGKPAPRNPARIHHCSADQFEEFARFVRSRIESQA